MVLAQYAVVMTQTFPKNDKYTGGGASISIYEPSASGAQYSSARMQMRNNLESIEMGWTVRRLYCLNSCDLRGGSGLCMYSNINSLLFLCPYFLCDGVILFR